MSTDEPGGTGVVVVDARGLRCPLPVIRLAERVRDLAPGTLVEVWATDPAAAADIPAWCRLRGQDHVATQSREPSDGGPHAAYVVRVVAPGGDPR
jgi:tRNA 2-thiouridine synthesizing protein A